ncbi:MAG: CZB domain-containing protein [Paracoccaceae bacterium]
MSETDLRSAIRAAIGAHGTWKLRLKTAITSGRGDITPDIAACDNRCDFGRWLYSPDVDANVRTGLPYKEVRRLHADFHTCAGEVLRQATTGNAAKASSLLDGDFADKSDKLKTSLSKWMTDLR